MFESYINAIDPPLLQRSITLDSAMWQHIHGVFKDSQLNKSEAARRLGIDRNTLKRWLGRPPPRPYSFRRAREARSVELSTIACQSDDTCSVTILNHDATDEDPELPGLEPVKHASLSSGSLFWRAVSDRSVTSASKALCICNAGDPDEIGKRDHLRSCIDRPGSHGGSRCCEVLLQARDLVVQDLLVWTRRLAFALRPRGRGGCCGKHRENQGSTFRRIHGPHQ